MTLNTAFALALEVAGRIQWPLGVAGALAVAAAIDLISGFRLTVPDEVIAEVEAVVHEIDELESRKKAASIGDYEPKKHKLPHANSFRGSTDKCPHPGGRRWPGASGCAGPSH
jgi:hypothetical protein